MKNKYPNIQVSSSTVTALIVAGLMVLPVLAIPAQQPPLGDVDAKFNSVTVSNSVNAGSVAVTNGITSGTVAATTSVTAGTITANSGKLGLVQIAANGDLTNVNPIATPFNILDADGLSVQSPAAPVRFKVTGNGRISNPVVGERVVVDDADGLSVGSGGGAGLIIAANGDISTPAGTTNILNRFQVNGETIINGAIGAQTIGLSSNLDVSGKTTLGDLNVAADGALSNPNVSYGGDVYVNDNFTVRGKMKAGSIGTYTHYDSAVTSINPASSGTATVSCQLPNQVVVSCDYSTTSNTPFAVKSFKPSAGRNCVASAYNNTAGVVTLYAGITCFDSSI